jgi:prepilin-type N-terminal cleavage/methylation domain-containing protein
MRNSGFTLIEVLIVIAIFAMIILVGAPLTGAWVTDASRLETEGQLTQAMGRAKAAALRNYMAATGDTPVTAICLADDNILTVLEGAPGTPSPDCNSATGTQLWRAKLHPSIAVKLNSEEFSCVYFDNKGTPIKDCANTISTLEFTLTAGGETEPVALY